MEFLHKTVEMFRHPAPKPETVSLCCPTGQGSLTSVSSSRFAADADLLVVPAAVSRFPRGFFPDDLQRFFPIRALDFPASSLPVHFDPEGQFP